MLPMGYASYAKAEWTDFPTSCSSAFGVHQCRCYVLRVHKQQKQQMTSSLELGRSEARIVSQPAGWLAGWTTARPGSRFARLSVGGSRSPFIKGSDVRNGGSFFRISLYATLVELRLVRAGPSFYPYHTLTWSY